MSADCIRRRCDGSLFHFHARGPAVPKERRSPNDDSVRGTAVRRSSTQLISDQLWHALAAADGMMRSTKYRTVRQQTIMNNRTQLVLDIRRKGDTDGPRKKLLDFGGSNKYHVTLGVRVSIWLWLPWVEDARRTIHPRYSVCIACIGAGSSRHATRDIFIFIFIHHNR